MTAIDTPARSLAQRQAALEVANATRLRRAQLKRDVKAGRESVADILLDPPEWALTMKVLELVLSVPKVGQATVNRLFHATMISPSKTIGGMTARQRGVLVRVLREKGMA